jgi:hypothetical protein
MKIVCDCGNVVFDSSALFDMMKDVEKGKPLPPGYTITTGKKEDEGGETEIYRDLVGFPCMLGINQLTNGD